MAGISVDTVTTTVSDAVENTVYTAVGLGILGFQHLQVQRRELERTLTATVRQLAEQVDRTVNRG